jgi:hypothetical protein
MREMVKKLEPQKIVVVICGDSTLSGGKGHCSVCFGEDMAQKERKQMEKSGYPIKGVFEVSTVNVFHRAPYYLSSNKDEPSKVNVYI